MSEQFEIATEELVTLDADATEADAPKAATESIVAAEATSETPTEAAPTAEETVAEPAAEVVAEEGGESVTAEAATTSDDDAPAEVVPETDDGKTRVVRVLAVGEEVTGTVKRVTDFGAFVDIGVGRDGLIHISELSVRRVAKVSDVLKKGQEVTAWIKELDRDRNRISLTLIPPGTLTVRDLEKDMLVEGTVTRILPYGAFIDIGVGRDALLHVREMGEGYVKSPEEVVKVGEKIEARIVELNKRRQRIDLSIKGLRAEPEPEPVAVDTANADAFDDEETVEDPFENVEVLTPMELAFKRAMSDAGAELEVSSGKGGKRSKKARRREQARAIQDEIISRTLQSNNG